MATQADRKAATVGAIRAAGRELLATRGFAATTIDDIALLAGVTKGAVYHHFAAKEDVFADLLETLQTELAARVVAAASKAGNIVRAIELGTRQFLLDCARPEVRQVVLIDGPAVLGWQRWREIDAAHFGSLLRQLMMTLRGVSALHPRDEALIHLLLGASTEAAMVCASAEDAPAATRHLVEAFRVLLQGIEAAEPPLRRGARRT